MSEQLDVAVWSSDSLWEKARLYASRASGGEQEGELFPFWSILAFELLSRTVVADVHPALLADPENPDNLLHVFGIGNLRSPKSVPTTTVLRRCVKIVEEFTESDRDGAIGLVRLRNEELHSGATPFTGLKTSGWLADYYRLCQILLNHLERELTDMFGPDEAAGAQKMISAAAEELVSDVNEEVAEFRRAFKKLGKKRQGEARARANNLVELRKSKASVPIHMGIVATCPACENQSWISGEFVRSGVPVADEDAIVQEIVKIPTLLECGGCQLRLEGHGRLHAIGAGGVFTGELREDPASFYQIEFDPSEVDMSQFFEPDYGND